MRKILLFGCISGLIFLSIFGIQAILPYFYLPRNNTPDHHSNVTVEKLQVVAKNLHIPWDIVFLPDGGMLVTERPGTIFYKNGSHETRIPVESTLHIEEGGLLGLVLHPDFEKNHWIYLYNTTKKNGKTFNRVERYRFENGSLNDQKIILDDIPGAKYHDGGRMAFGPKGFLYITTGDATKPDLAQDTVSLSGKILRIKDDGSIPADNPFGNEVWSYGHRNPQGITWDEKGNMWSTEHGPSGWESGQDELNLIERGKNYGWPIVKGDEQKKGMTPPVIHSGADDTWAPTSALYWDGSVFFGGLRGEALYEAEVDKKPVALKEHFKGKLGRIRAVVLGPDGFFYFTTSNTDGRGFPKKGDDKIYKIDPKIFKD